MNKPNLIECFADNGEHSHWELLESESGVVLWTEIEEMQGFDKAYQQAMKDTGCNYGGAFAKTMYRFGADNLMEQAVANSRKKYQQGVDFMKWKAIEAFKENCQHPRDTEPCKCKLCVRWVAGHCELLDGFIEKLDL